MSPEFSGPDQARFPLWLLWDCSRAIALAQGPTQFLSFSMEIGKPLISFVAITIDCYNTIMAIPGWRIADPMVRSALWSCAPNWLFNRIPSPVEVAAMHEPDR